METLSTLPPEVQDDLGRQLQGYAAKWRDLKAAIDEGTAELARGDGIEVADTEAFIDRIVSKA
jgi:hypothetical protein